MKIRQFNKDDLTAVVATQKQNPAAAQWLEGDYARLAEDAGGMVLAAELETGPPRRGTRWRAPTIHIPPVAAASDRHSQAEERMPCAPTPTPPGDGGQRPPLLVVGFAAFQLVADEAELRNLAVAPEYQRRGVGRALLEEARKRLVEAGAQRLYLEVRPSNKPALELYQSLGFSLLGVRKDYYRDPLEDAYVMCLTVRCQ